MTPLRSCVASPSIGTSSTVEQGTLHCKATPPLQRLKFSGGNPEIPPRLLLAHLDEPHHVAFRIGEESERDPARHLDRWLNGLATEAFDLVQCRLRVVNTNVERDVPRTLWRFADPAVDATPPAPSGAPCCIPAGCHPQGRVANRTLPSRTFAGRSRRAPGPRNGRPDSAPCSSLGQHALRYMTTSVIIGGIISADACRPPSFDPSPAPGSWPDERR